MKLWKTFDFCSLRIRLTLGIAAVSALGLGGLATWMSMQMQQILVSTHKANVTYISERFPHDIEIYSEMVSLNEGMQKAINNLSTETRLLWINNSAGEIVAKSPQLKQEKIGTVLLALKNVTPLPQVQDLNGRYWLICATSLQVKNTNLGQLFIAQDITEDQIMFFNLIRNLSFSTLIAIAIIIVVIAYYISYAVKPLQKISQLTANISADQLKNTQINLENAPTEVKELAETFDQMLVRLSEAWEHQRQLLSNVSHELRTPLTIISGYLQSTLRRGNNLTEIQREALITAASEADRTVQLLQDLLDLARADSGRMHFQLELVDLNNLVAEIVGMARQYRDRKIQLEYADREITIKVDVNRLKQVLLNLIDNAVKYSEENQPINLKIIRQENQAIIEVSDQGLGISLQQQGRIFERFYRIDEARNRAEGTGLGLSIVKTLVEGMGGKISVKSQIGKGSTFRVNFPVI